MSFGLNLNLGFGRPFQKNSKVVWDNVFFSAKKISATETGTVYFQASNIVATRK